ncbi:MAG TPA: nuclear transport factor 2 family protein [Gemmatimonadaceae bacterium]|nr:nuclear transport factor 2 family protein [Gemmatimonadaceae bacterium]
MTNRLVVILASLAVAANTHAAIAQAATTQTRDSLFLAIAARDSAFFDAYNKCELAKMKSYFTADLEFYHDQSGLSRLPGVMSDLRKYVCGKVHRDAVPGTLEVNPLKGYGAVATGLHRFCDARKYQTCEEATSGVAKFVTLWKLQNGKWYMSRVISYDHLSRPD